MMQHSKLHETILVTPSACTNAEVMARLAELSNVTKSEIPGKYDPSEVRGLWVRHDSTIDESVLDSFPNLEFVASTTTADIHIDVIALKSRRIELLKLDAGDPQLSSITSTVDHTWSLILHHHGNVAEGSEFVRGGRWNDSKLVRNSQLSTMTLGIVGAGRIGFRVARIGQAFGMRVIVYDPSNQVRKAALAEQMALSPSIDDVFRDSDYVSLHATSSPNNFGMIDSGVLDYSRGVHLFNTARGELVDEIAVVQSLRKGVLGGYHADVLVAETGDLPIHDSPIYKGMQAGLDITLTPHLGGASANAMKMAETMILGKIESFLRSRQDISLLSGTLPDLTGA